MKPYKDQQESIDKILEHFKTNNRLLFCLPTGGG
jgi:superfamily II DNA or RNA helicase